MKRFIKKLAMFCFNLVILLALSFNVEAKKQNVRNVVIPCFNGNSFVILNGNNPNFTLSGFDVKVFEYYSKLDYLGRCGVAYANLGKELMPFKKRGTIGLIRPTGWHTVRYDNIESKYLYNRCHLIGYQLTGENANIRNLFTGTRFMNVMGMLPFENLVANYIRKTNNHVLYRVTPIFNGDNLLADGVQMEAMSVEDFGKGILFNVFVYNNQPGIIIDYKTGKSKRGTDFSIESDYYVLNVRTGVFHSFKCVALRSLKVYNMMKYVGDKSDLVILKFKPCSQCCLF